MPAALMPRLSSTLMPSLCWRAILRPSWARSSGLSSFGGSLTASRARHTGLGYPRTERERAFLGLRRATLWGPIDHHTAESRLGHALAREIFGESVGSKHHRFASGAQRLAARLLRQGQSQRTRIRLVGQARRCGGVAAQSRVVEPALGPDSDHDDASSVELSERR